MNESGPTGPEIPDQVQLDVFFHTMPSGALYDLSLSGNTRLIISTTELPGGDVRPHVNFLWHPGFTFWHPEFTFLNHSEFTFPFFWNSPSSPPTFAFPWDPKFPFLWHPKFTFLVFRNSPSQFVLQCSLYNALGLKERDLVTRIGKEGLETLKILLGSTFSFECVQLLKDENKRETFFIFPDVCHGCADVSTQDDPRVNRYLF
jgi:hypothetical protein